MASTPACCTCTTRTACATARPIPDRLYQQNHCGIYRLDRPGEEWIRIGNNMPKKVGDVGFPMVVHPRDDKVAWVFPMDGSGVWPRTSPDGQARRVRHEERRRANGSDWTRACHARMPGGR